MYEKNGEESSRNEIKNMDFFNEDIRIDGKHFIKCRFSECTFVYGGGKHPIFDEVKFKDMEFALEDNALSTVQILSAIYNHFGEDGRSFVKTLFKKIKRGPPDE